MLNLVLRLHWLVRSEVRSLGQKHVDVRRGVSHKPTDERGLAAVTAEVARVEKPLSGRLDEQHVGIEGGVVGENRRNGEWPDRERSRAAIPCLECPGERTTRNVAGERDQFRRRRSRPYRPTRGKLFNQPPMVLVRMADEDGRRACPIKRCGQETGGAFRRVERPSCAEDEAVSVRVRYLDATPADLLSAAVDGKS